MVVGVRSRTRTRTREKFGNSVRKEPGVSFMSKCHGHKDCFRVGVPF